MTHSRFFGFVQILFAVVIVGGPVFSIQAQDVSDLVVKAEKERIAAIAKAKKAAVSVFARGGQGGGSGVVITPDGYALTNFHVTKPAGNNMKCSMPDGVLYDAVIVGIDPTGDVAMIKLLGRDDFPHAELGDSDKTRVGDWCFAIGNPFLLATDFQPTVTYGIVSGVHRYQYPAGTLLEYADCIQTDASINPGNSGGPLFNAQGQLIGINGRGSFEKRGRVNVGVGYAISINQIKNFMGYLRSGRIVDHATLGATVSSDEEGHVTVTNILESSDAFRRGLRYGDEIVTFGGRQIGTVNAFKNALGIYPKGWRVPLTFRTEGQSREIMVRLAGLHGTNELIDKIQRPTKPPKSKPKKKDGEPAPDKKDEDKKPKLPIPIPKLKPGAKAKVPDHIAKLIKARRGYANYYFNELNRDRVWNAFQDSGDFSKLAGVWKITGKTDTGGDVDFALAQTKVAATFPVEAAFVETDRDLADQLGPAGSGGLLVALHLWQRMLRLGPTQYGDVFYLGTAPIPTQKELVDVLDATHDVVKTKFMFDSKTGRLVAMEMYPDLNVDPCEIYFGNYQEFEGRMLPHRIEVRHGDSVFTIISIESFELSTVAEKKA